ITFRLGKVTQTYRSKLIEFARAVTEKSNHESMNALKQNKHFPVTMTEQLAYLAKEAEAEAQITLRLSFLISGGHQTNVINFSLLLAAVALSLGRVWFG